MDWKDYGALLTTAADLCRLGAGDYLAVGLLRLGSWGYDLRSPWPFMAAIRPWGLLVRGEDHRQGWPGWLGTEKTPCACHGLQCGVGRFAGGMAKLRGYGCWLRLVLGILADSDLSCWPKAGINHTD